MAQTESPTASPISPAETPPSPILANTPEAIARRTLEAEWGAKEIKISRVLPNCLGGTLCVVEYLWQGDNYDGCVLIRNDRGVIYDSVLDVMRMIAEDKASLLSRVSEPKVVIAILTFVLLLASVAAYFAYPAKEVSEPFRSGLTAVIGYWLGQILPSLRSN